MRNLLFFCVLAATIGCASAGSDESAASSDSAISEETAYRQVLEAHVFKSGHVACGRTLTVREAYGTEGTYELDKVPCEGDDFKELHVQGHFTVVGGYLGGLLTNPKMDMLPVLDPMIDENDPHLAREQRPNRFTIEKYESGVSLTDVDGTLLPEGLLD